MNRFINQAKKRFTIKNILRILKRKNFELNFENFNKFKF